MWEVQKRVNSGSILGQFWSILSKTWSILVNSGQFSVKQGQNSAKQGQNSAKQCQQCQNSAKQCKTRCVLLPLGSPTGPLKRSYVHVPVVPWSRRGGGAGHERGVLWCGLGGYTGWVIPGPHPSSPLCCEEDPNSTQRSGPRKPPAGRLEWVGCGVRGLPGVRRRGRVPTPAGPGRPSPGGPPWYPLRMPPLGQKARFKVIS